MAVEELGLDLVGHEQEEDVGDGGGVREVGGGFEGVGRGAGAVGVVWVGDEDFGRVSEGVGGEGVAEVEGCGVGVRFQC